MAYVILTGEKGHFHFILLKFIKLIFFFFNTRFKIEFYTKLLENVALLSIKSIHIFTHCDGLEEAFNRPLFAYPVRNKSFSDILATSRGIHFNITIDHCSANRF